MSSLEPEDRTPGVPRFHPCKFRAVLSGMLLAQHTEDSLASQAKCGTIVYRLNLSRSWREEDLTYRDTYWIGIRSDCLCIGAASGGSFLDIALHLSVLDFRNLWPRVAVVFTLGDSRVGDLVGTTKGGRKRQFFCEHALTTIFLHLRSGLFIGECQTNLGATFLP